MTIETSRCEEFEIAALRRSREELDADTAGRLQPHLEACASCRGFAATAEATEAVLRGRARDASAAHDWARVRAGFRRRRRADRNEKLGGLASCLLMAGIAWWAGGARVGAALALLFVVLVAVVYWRFVRPEQRRVHALASIDAEMLAFCRADLDKEIEGHRRGRPIVVVLVVLFAANALLMVGHVVKNLVFGEGLPRLEGYLVTFATFAFVAGLMWLRGRLLLPRLERERQELGS